MGQFRACTGRITAVHVVPLHGGGQGDLIAVGGREAGPVRVVVRLELLRVQVADVPVPRHPISGCGNLAKLKILNIIKK